MKHVCHELTTVEAGLWVPGDSFYSVVYIFTFFHIYNIFVLPYFEKLSKTEV